MGRKRIWNNDAERKAATRAAKKATNADAYAYALTDADRRGCARTIDRECANFDSVSKKCIANGCYQNCYCIGADGCIHCKYFFDHVLPFAKLHRDTADLAERITEQYLNADK